LMKRDVYFDVRHVSNPEVLLSIKGLEKN
jgi:hypothetical protein